MSTRELLAIVKGRGLEIVLKEDDRPVLKGMDAKGKVTDALLAVLKFHRERIIQELKVRV